MKKILLGTLVLALIFACTSLKYQDDVGFLVSAQAGSPEYPVYINGHLCVDMENFPGLCAKRIKSTEDITFNFDPQPYAYILTMSCTTGVGPVPGATVPSNQAYSFTITADKFSQFKSFTCIGEISPQDRTQPISATFEVKFKIVDAKYTMRERIYIGYQDDKKALVLGEFARDAWVFDDGKWTQHDKDTIVELKGDPKLAKAYSSSLAMRFNYYNLGDADSGVK